MDPTLLWGYVFIFGVLPVLGAGAALAWFRYSRAQQRRRGELEAFAAEHGLRYSPTAPADHQTRYVDFYPLGRWRSHARHVVHGRRNGIDWDAFEYVPPRGGGAGDHRNLGVVASHVPGMTLPRARVRPENVLHKLIDVVGLRDIQTGSLLFDERFRVSGTDEPAVRRLFGPRMTKWFASRPAENDWRTSGDAIVVIRRKPYASEELAGVMGAIESFIEHIPGEFLASRPTSGRDTDADDEPRHAGDAAIAPATPAPTWRSHAVTAAIVLGMFGLAIAMGLAIGGVQRGQKDAARAAERLRQIPADIAHQQKLIVQAEAKLKELDDQAGVEVDPAATQASADPLDPDTLRAELDQIERTVTHELMEKQRVEARRRIEELTEEQRRLGR